MIVETYSDKYRGEVAQIVENFHAESLGEYDSEFKKEVILKTIVDMEPTQSGHAFLLIIDGRCEGIIAGLGVVSMFNQKKIFQELIWYVNKEYRSKGVFLLKKAEECLKSLGFENMIMAVMENSKTEKIKSLYERMGYRTMETHFIKAL